jgi:TonB family protein
MVERVVPDPGPPPAPDPAESKPAEQTGQDAAPVPDAATAPQVARNTPGSTTPRFSGSGLSESLRNLQRTIEREQWDNQRGGGSFGPAIQFDTKGVEFGPWVRRFIAQVRRNWEPLIPLAAMSMSGHVVITFNVHKSGALTDLAVVQPCPIDAFNTAAYGALVSSNPTAPLPPEYPSDKAFFTVTFFYNEEPR